MDMTYESFVAELKSAFPELHLHEPDLPNISMGDLVFLLKDAQTDPDRLKQLTDRALAFIDRAGLSTDDQVVNIVAFSFLENLRLLGPGCVDVSNRLGPGGRRALKRVSGPICGQ
jgi:hypothetical protein